MQLCSCARPSTKKQKTYQSPSLCQLNICLRSQLQYLTYCTTFWPGFYVTLSAQLQFSSRRTQKSTKNLTRDAIVNSLLSGSFLIKFSSLSAPTEIEELTVGSDEKNNTGQPRQESNPGSWLEFSSDPTVSSSIFVGAVREDNLIQRHYVSS